MVDDLYFTGIYEAKDRKMFRITFDEYCFAMAESYPNLYREYCKQATLAEFFSCEDASGSLSVVLVMKDDNWPFLVVAQEYSPGPTSGFYPGIAFIPETHHLFIGAGKRLLVYTLDLKAPRKIREEIVLSGFWGWRLYGEYVLMSSELEFAAWDKFGQKCWNCFVEPPWTYTIQAGVVHLDVMGKQVSFQLSDGPDQRRL